MTGTLINAAAVIAGSIAGLIIHEKLPQKIIKIIFHSTGIFKMLPSLIIVII